MNQSTKTLGSDAGAQAFVSAYLHESQEAPIGFTLFGSSANP